MQEFAKLIDELQCAVVLIRHLTKSTREKAIYRGQGNIAFVGVARFVISVAANPESDDEDFRLLVITKINNAKPVKAREFFIQETPTLKDPDHSTFEWGEFVDLNAEQVINAPPNKNVAHERDQAKKMLLDVLDEGEMERARLIKMAEARDIKERTLERAAADLSIHRRTVGFGKNKRVYWSLSQGDDKTPCAPLSREFGAHDEKSIKPGARTSAPGGAYGRPHARQSSHARQADAHVKK